MAASSSSDASSDLAKALEGYDTKTATEILLDGKVVGLMFTDANCKLLSRFEALKKLSLVGNKLKSLDNFPTLSSLKTGPDRNFWSPLSSFKTGIRVLYNRSIPRGREICPFEKEARGGQIGSSPHKDVYSI